MYPTLPEPASCSTTERRFLPNALLVPGLLHIVNNAMQEVASKLQYWDTWFTRLQRFVNFCVKPSHVASCEQNFLQRQLGSLYINRWNEVVKFCLRLSSLLPLLRILWDERRSREARRIPDQPN